MTRVSPDTGTTQTGYDLADNLTGSTDGAGVVTNHSYDALNRELLTSYPSDAAENVSRSYDQTGHGDGIGHLTSLTDAVGSLSLMYDERGNRVAEARVSAGTTYTTQYAYDPASRLAGVLYPSGNMVTYGRDAAGQVSGVTGTPKGGAAVSLAGSLSWQPYGPLGGLTYGNGIAETRSYDASYRLGTLATGSVQKLGYGYYANDTVKTITDGIVAGNSQGFTYDPLLRVQSATGSYPKQGFAYDASGNWTSMTSGGHQTTAYSVAPDSNVLTGYGNVTVATSGAGNVTGLTPASGAATVLGYNAAERLASVTIGGKAAGTYSYDAFGRRAGKSLAGVAGTFLYDPSGHLLEESDSSSGSLTVLDTVYLEGVPLADISGTGAVSYLHTDRLGTVQVATTSSGAVACQGAYQPFGTVTASQGLLAQNLRFPGQYADAKTGWYQNGFRDYDPAIGRYLEADPIGLTAGVNLYAYVGNNPLGLTDPDGTNPLAGAIEGGEIGAEFGAAGGPIGAAAGGIIGAGVGFAAGDLLGNALDNIVFSKGGNQNKSDTGLRGVSDEDLQTQLDDPSTSSEQKQRLIRELKVRKLRNKQKRGNKGCG